MRNGMGWGVWALLALACLPQPAWAKKPPADRPTVASLQLQAQELNLAAYEGDRERFLEIVSGGKFKGFSNYPWMGRLVSEFFDGEGKPTRAGLLITHSRVSGNLGWVQYLKYTRDFTPRGDEVGRSLWWRWEEGRWVVLNPYEPRQNPDEAERARWQRFISETDGCSCRPSDEPAVEKEVRAILDNLVSGDWEANIPRISAYAYYGGVEASWCNSQYRVERAKALADDFRGVRGYEPELQITCAEGLRYTNGNMDTSRSGMVRWNATVQWRTGRDVSRWLSLSLGEEDRTWRVWGWEIAEP